MKTALMVVNEFAAGWLNALVSACWQGGLAMALVWVVCRGWPQISPRSKCWLWRLAYLKLAAAFLWPVPINLPLLPAPILPSARQRFSESPTARLVPLAEPASPALASPVINRQMAPVQLSFAGWLLLGWSIGVGAGLVRILGDWRKALRLRRSGRVADDELLTQCCVEAAQRMRFQRMPRVLISDQIAQPLLLGPLSPVIVIPASFLASSSPPRLRMMLAHELAHAKRLDLWWSCLFALGEVLFYFHPLIWLSRAEWRLTQELACDALAVGAAGYRLGDYGAMLLDIAAPPNRLAAISPSVTVSIIETKKNLERRLKAMKLIRQTPSRRVWLATTCILGAGIVGALPWRVTAQAPAASPQAQGASKATAFAAQAPSDAKATVVSPEARRKSGNASSGPATEVQVFPLKYANAEEVADNLQKLNLDRAVTIVADRRTGAVIVQAPREEMGSVTELIAKLDAKLAEDARGGESAMGTNASNRPIAIVPPRPGFVQKVFVTSGTTVKQGEPLIQLENVEFESKLNNALVQLDIIKAALMVQEAEANGVRREYGQLKARAQKGLASSDALEIKQTALEVAEARILKAQAELKLAQQQAEQAKMEVNALTIRAPKSGTVTRTRVQPGEYVAGPLSPPLMMIGP